MLLSVVIITKNAATKLEDCLKCIKNLSDEIIVLDGGSIDDTLKIAKINGAIIKKQVGKNYSQWRNQGVKMAKGEWVFFIDYDERTTALLNEEIKTVIKNSDFSGYNTPRLNYVFGKALKHGGWWPDHVLRLIKKENFITYVGEVHEQPKINGEIGYLLNHLIHLKEDNLSDMVKKTNFYSEYEAKLLYDAGHPKMAWWRFLRVIITELWYRLVTKLGFLDGPEGIIYCLYQGYSKFITYAKLWEMQNTHKWREN